MSVKKSELMNPVVRLVFEVDSKFRDEDHLHRYLAGILNKINSYVESDGKKLVLKTVSAVSEVTTDHEFEKMTI